MVINTALLDSLTKQAKESPRLRINCDLRDSETEPTQRMLNAMEPGTVVPIHRHQKSSETVVCIRGRLREYYYDELERVVTDVFELSADGPMCGLTIPAGQWHSVEVLESGTVIMEVKTGMFEPLSDADILSL